jgi:hypothetical protein
MRAMDVGRRIVSNAEFEVYPLYMDLSQEPEEAGRQSRMQSVILTRRANAPQHAITNP